MYNTKLIPSLPPAYNFKTECQTWNKVNLKSEPKLSSEAVWAMMGLSVC